MRETIMDWKKWARVCYLTVWRQVFGFLIFGLLMAGQGQATEVVLLYTGNTQGFLEVCGCSENQLGGVARRAAMVRDLRYKHPQAILLDAGGLFAGDSILDQLRCAIHLDAMRAMQYDVAHVDVGAFQFGTDFLKTMRDTSQVPFVNANVRVDGNTWVPAFRVVVREGIRIGVIGVGAALPAADVVAMGMQNRANDAKNVEIVDAVLAVQTSIQKMGGVDMVVVLSDLDRETEHALVRAVAQVDVVISTRSNEMEIETEQALILGTQPQGKAVGYAVLDVVNGHIVKRRVVSSFVTENIGEDVAVKKMVDGFYAKVAESATLQMTNTPRFVGADLEKQVVSGHNGYMGAEACAGCHEKEYADWQSTPHAHAFQRLLQQQKHVQPDCVPCHTTGFGFETGFRIGRDHESLTNVQCEVCHGPGGQHVKRPEKRNIRHSPTPDLCQQCHDADQTPDFMTRFPDMLAEITHHGQGQKKPSLQTTLDLAQEGKPLVELFVMADCPYGIRAENALIPLLRQMGDQVDLKLYFIADEVGVDDVDVSVTDTRRTPGCSGTATGTGRFRSLHGDAEVTEGIRQLVIGQLYPERLWDYILCRNTTADDWRKCAMEFGLDVAKIEEMVAGDMGATLFSNNIRRANLLGIQASPTVRVNGKEVEAFLDPTALAQAICASDSNVDVCAQLPLCRTDEDCENLGKIGICVHANTPQAKCEVREPVAFRVQVLNDSTCVVCETYPFVRSTLALFPLAKFETVDVASLEGQALQKRYGLDRVPSFVLDAAFAKTARFERFQRTVMAVGDGFVPDMRMISVAKTLSPVDVLGIDVFLDLAHPASGALAERLLRWVRDVNDMNRLRVHLVGQGPVDQLFRNAFAQDVPRAWDALLAYLWGQQQRRSDLSAETCLQQAGFGVVALHLPNDALTHELEQMRLLGGRIDMVPFVVLDGQVVVMGAGLGRIETVFYQMHPELAQKDRNSNRP
jgi:hypothetical protein